MDRISTEHDPVLKQIDPEMLNGFSSSSQTIDFSSNFSRTNASSKPCENRLSLSEILSNIRSCRLQCFQPRLLNVQDIDSEECTSRKPGQTVSSKRVSAASVALLNTSKNGISGKPLSVTDLCCDSSLLRVHYGIIELLLNFGDLFSYFYLENKSQCTLRGNNRLTDLNLAREWCGECVG